MKIVINRKSLSKCLDVVSRALPQKPIIPIYTNFLLDIVGDKCYVYASNGKLQIKGLFTVDSKEDIKICVPGTTLLNTVRLLLEDEINFNYDPEKFILNISAKKKKFKITGVNPKHFGIQTIPEDNTTFKLLASKIIPQIAMISKIIKWDDLRIQLAGVTIVTKDDDVHISGTHESFFFCRAMLGVKSDKEFGIVLPKDISIALGSMQGVGDIQMSITDRAIFCTLEGFEMYSVLIDVKKTVSLDQFFTHERDSYIVVDKNDISMTIKRLMNYSLDSSVVRMELSGEEFKMSCENDDFGRGAEEVLDIKNNNAKNCVVGISMKYLSTIVNSIASDSIKIFLIKHNKPAFFQRYDETGDSEAWGCAPMILAENVTI